MKTILVMNDDSTWCMLDACRIFVISDDEYELLCNDSIPIADLNPVSETEFLNNGS